LAGRVEGVNEEIVAGDELVDERTVERDDPVAGVERSVRSRYVGLADLQASTGSGVVDAHVS